MSTFLDSQMLEQLKGVFAVLENKIEVVYAQSAHEDQKDLVAMLTEVASTSDNIEAREEASWKSPVPTFKFVYKGQETGLSFTGIPGGHEFTTFVVAILNIDGKGKGLDPLLAQRAKRLKKNISVESFISLTCENCPVVVQALNQIALAHGSFKHHIVDGAYAQDEVTKLGIQGVPSLIANQKMFHSGRIQILDLLDKLESVFGLDDQAAPAELVDVDLGHFDVVVMGGGPAGASSAIYSVRKGLKTALIAERIGGQVQETKGIENFISVVYTEGPQLSAQLSQHIASYPIEVFENRRIKEVVVAGQEKTIHLESGERLRADSIIVTTGAKWRELNIEGEKEYLGRGVAYCPHCDGPFYKGKKVVVVGGGNSGVEAAIDLAGIVKEVVLIEYNDQLKADQVLVDKLKSLPNASILLNSRTQKVVGDGAKVTHLEYIDRVSEKTEVVDVDGIFVQIGLVPNSQFLKGVVEMSKFGEIIIDEKCRTSQKGIYAAGDVTTVPYKQIVIAMGEGAKAALSSFEDRIRQEG